MLRILIKLLVVAALAALVTVAVVDAAAAEERPPEPIEYDDEPDVDDLPTGEEATEYRHALTEDVRIVEYEEDDGNVRAIIDADEDVSGLWVDSGVQPDGALPPEQDLHLYEGRNEITFSVEERPIVVVNVDGERYAMNVHESDEIQISPADDRPDSVTLTFGLVTYLSLMGGWGLFLIKTAKTRVKDV